MEDRRHTESVAKRRAFDAPRLCAALIALLGWIALGIELAFTVSGAVAKHETVAEALVRFFSFFTIQTNLLLALIVTAACLRPNAAFFLTRPGVKAAAVVYIIVVGVVYAVLLSHLYHWKGSILFADSLLHKAIPVLYPLYWLAFVPKGQVRWSDPVRWLLFPVLYFAYTLARGAVVGAYPYPFLDVNTLGYPQVFINACGLLAVFLVLGVAVAALVHALARRKSRRGGLLGSAADF